MKLIDKEALVAEIKRRKSQFMSQADSFHKLGMEEKRDHYAILASNMHSILSFIDTLEVKDFWKSADGDDLPEIDREVVALLGNGKVGFAHRPPEYWDGKNIITGKVTRNYPKTYDKGGWNIPNVKWWLDVELPKEKEL